MWYVWYNKDKQSYQLTNNSEFAWIACFKIFDMAYQYVTRMNGTNDVQAYSKWTAAR